MLGLSAGVILLCSVGTVVSARMGTVELKDGTREQGDVIEDSRDRVIINVDGIKKTFRRSQIDGVTYAVTIEGEYRARKEALDPDDQEAGYRLVRWLFEQQAWELVRDEAQLFLKQFPGDQRGLIALKLAENRIAKKVGQTVADEDEDEDEGDVDGEDGDTGDNVVNMKSVAKRRLTDKQVNRIRLMEVDFEAPRKPRLTVPRKVRETILRTYSGEPGVPMDRRGKADFLNNAKTPGWKVLDLFFQLERENRALLDGIRMNQDPAAMRAFKRVHRAYVLNYCGTAGCHGGANAKEIFIFRSQPTSDRTVYSNFYTLHLYQAGQNDMIARDKPDQSLLISYGQNHTTARVRHPDVPGWRPFFRGDRDPMQRTIMDWMASLFDPAPDYDVNWTPPIAPNKVTKAPSASGADEPQGEADADDDDAEDQEREDDDDEAADDEDSAAEDEDADD